MGDIADDLFDLALAQECGYLDKNFNYRREEMEEEKKNEDCIYEFYVAGVQHHQLHTCIGQVNVGQELILRPDPGNRFDPNAVAIKTLVAAPDGEAEVMLGFVPKAKGDYSSKVTALLDLGRNIKCIVTELNKEAKTWEQLKVAIVEETDA